MVGIGEKLKTSSILVVDDNPSNVLLLEALLQQEGYINVESTTRSTLVKSLYQENNYDLILLEIPSFERSSFLFKSFASFADLVLMVFKCKQSNRKKIDPMIKEINSLNLDNVKGVLNVINKKFN